MLEPHSLNLLIHVILLLAAFFTVLLQLLLFLGNLLCKGLFLVLEGRDLTLFTSQVGSKFFDLRDKFTSLLIEFIDLLLELSG